MLESNAKIIKFEDVVLSGDTTINKLISSKQTLTFQLRSDGLQSFSRLLQNCFEIENVRVDGAFQK